MRSVNNFDEILWLACSRLRLFLYCLPSADKPLPRFA